MNEAERWVTRTELAGRYPIPAATWSRWAYLGKGPRYVRVGKRALYKIGDVERWLEKHQVSGFPTSEGRDGRGRARSP